MSELPEDGLLSSGMMVVSTQSSIQRESHPMSVSHSACGQSSPGDGATGNESAGDADISSLLGMLASVTDPRSPQGIQHALVFVLAVCVVAMLAGAKNYREIGGHAADAPRANPRSLYVDHVTLSSHKLECPALVAADPFRGFLDGVHVFHAE